MSLLKTAKAQGEVELSLLVCGAQIQSATVPQLNKFHGVLPSPLLSKPYLAVLVEARLFTETTILWL